jgi:hypothetical protein
MSSRSSEGKRSLGNTPPSSPRKPDTGKVVPNTTAEVSLKRTIAGTWITDPIKVPQQFAPPAVADDNYEELVDDGDSTYGAMSDMTDTESMHSSILRFREENGRTYHSFGR